MLKRRLIPVVLMRGGVVVQSKAFRRYQALGNPSTVVERLSAWASDELVYLDISRGGGYDLGRDDLGGAIPEEHAGILRDMSRRCFTPLAVGGGICTITDGARRRDHDFLARLRRAVPRHSGPCGAGTATGAR